MDDTLENTTVDNGQEMAIDIITLPVNNRPSTYHMPLTDWMGENNTEKSRDPVRPSEENEKLFQDE